MAYEKVLEVTRLLEDAYRMDELTADDLHRVERVAARLRRSLLAKQAYSFRVGDVVEVLPGVRPKFLVGKQGIVTGRTDTRVKVVFDGDEVGEKWGHGDVRVPAESLKKVGD